MGIGPFNNVMNFNAIVSAEEKLGHKKLSSSRVAFVKFWY